MNELLQFKTKLIEYLLMIVFITVGCGNQNDSFSWVDTIPKPWTLSESEFETYLPKFQERFPDYKDRIKALNLWRVGTPYGMFCLGEEAGKDTGPIIRNDSSDCTVHVLTTLAFAESFTWENARDAMVDIHYKMDENGEKKPTYQSRWHYTSDRLLNHERTENITSLLVPRNDLEAIEIELNRKQDGEEFLNLDWSSKEIIHFIPSSKINKKLLKKLPAVCGVAFVKRKYFKLGIVIAHEGYFIDNANIIHASSEFGKTMNVDFLEYYFHEDEPRFDGVMFYKLNPK
ncbi:MAG: DUF1460 domain-containing protein [Candidatus Marinimicrobia bacterium]|jgi:hypothetical protein|nr:DUF1460 domain-containing protein [Candidatus Neomarinimicrobiota bacterium]MBT3839824.1 DUF1460 domain-containing protein [Candidatus Neomarinimicrobiota bacterium]MBT3998412.1 DUF1460 domain-containing protein [Candidatus Neomarinimicrobiota bacterium]MBT4282268.1 DUF1460 domain-containing protein [Candidatus Neomarinimicrobiota bacterium]MBT4580155.1 DUF1460 domain-containing protein [Candidatus Neomarinimicrobiota bacterium]